MKKIPLLIGLGCLGVVLVLSSTLFVAALSTGKSPAELLFPVSEQQARVIAQRHGIIREVEPATASNPQYEVEVFDGFNEREVTIDATTGAVVATEEDLDASEADNSPITESEARYIALREVGGRVTDVEVERRNGQIVYEIEIKKNGEEADVHIDATTGYIVSIEWEDEEDDD
ncbi:PepSY domain-containing protein [Candidatus Woesearchaeota archaeon]|nr:PepSY domain-containing protein [Candidatus Woesearchaeota archaeon]